MPIQLLRKLPWAKPHFILMIGVFLFFLFGSVFIKITNEVGIEKEFLPYDQTASNWMFHNQEPYDRIFFLVLTALGNAALLGLLSLFVSGWLWYTRRRMESLLLLAGFSATAISVYIIKYFTARDRPSVTSLVETTASFPSGHAALSLFCFGFFAYLLSRQIRRKTYAVIMFAAGLALTGLIGTSRIYLNVHWLSDVLGGFVLAAAYLSICIGVMEDHNHRASPWGSST